MENREERSFGLSTGGAFGLLAAFAQWRGRSGPAALLAILAAGLLGSAFGAPALLRQPRVYWMRLSRALAWVNTRILLSVIFLLLLTPVGFALRLTAWDPLGRRRRADRSGWVPYPDRRRDPRHYEKLY